MYAVAEMLVSLQGEGRHTGRRAVFLRLAGCNLWNGRHEDRAKGRGACALWCDTDFSPREGFTAPAIAKRAEELWGSSVEERWVIATGGEPLLQLDNVLVTHLARRGFRVAVETNGTMNSPVLANIDWLTVSPKLDRAGRPLELQVREGDELKVVLPGSLDEGDWTLELLDELQRTTKFSYYYVQPMDPLARESQKYQERTQEAVMDCAHLTRARPGWLSSMQMHKVWDLP